MGIRRGECNILPPSQPFVSRLVALQISPRCFVAPHENPIKRDRSDMHRQRSEHHPRVLVIGTSYEVLSIQLAAPYATRANGDGASSGLIIYQTATPVRLT